MSFKKKTVVISGGTGTGAVGRTPAQSMVPGRVPAVPISTSGPAQIRGGPVARGPVPGSGAGIAPGLSTSRGLASVRTVDVTIQNRGSSSSQISTSNIMEHDGVRPSLQTSAPTISLGSSSLDKLLNHGGLPLGSLLAVEESGSTDFASIILRSFAAQGIVHARLLDQTKKAIAPTRIVVVGGDDSWGMELPGVYKDKKEAARENLRKEQSRISVGNLANNPSTTRITTGSNNEEINSNSSPSVTSSTDSASANETSTASGDSTTANTTTSGESRSSHDMKIAWRYAQNSAPKSNVANETVTSKPNYTTLFDFTSRLIPRPSVNEISYIPVKTSFASIISQLETISQQASSKGMVLRVVVPSLLHPAIYPPHFAHPNELIPFLHSLRGLCRKYPQTLTVIISLPLQLFPRDTALIRWFELLCDGVLHLEPFPEEIINELREANSKDIGGSSSSKTTSSSNANQSQGLVHIYKLPVFSEKGVMAVRKSEHAFRVGRRQFEVQEWGIPVEDAPGPDTEESKKLDY
ncbi:Elongator subunit ELP4 [Sugiyamaella lignohabitans]|uniref:Elongator complex protein 4 n=1 Tax=Sugiyamaella lignohabitans TaxID=796027 RepID=A0A167DGA1_9ASCO|nr:Elongator subunit ELP4 [Sugiyamaella lignohabitans]ANB12883.1 Elongator subunit ELP4 [Sugiyamaella lignohabitans]